MAVILKNQGLLRLKKYLIKHNVTNRQLSYDCKICLGSLVNKLNGRRAFKPNEIRTISKYLNLSAEQIVFLFELKE